MIQLQRVGGRAPEMRATGQLAVIGESGAAEKERWWILGRRQMASQNLSFTRAPSASCQGWASLSVDPRERLARLEHLISRTPSNLPGRRPRQPLRSIGAGQIKFR